MGMFFAGNHSQNCLLNNLQQPAFLEAEFTSGWFSFVNLSAALPENYIFSLLVTNFCFLGVKFRNVLGCLYRYTMRNVLP